MPGAPSSASTARPESSANAGRPEACAPASALIRAFAAKVVPVSSGSGKFRSLADSASTPCSPSNSRISASLPLLCVAMTRLPVMARCISHHGELLQTDQLADAFARQRDQRRQLLLAECDLLGGGLHFHDIAGAGHDEIGVGVGLGIFRVVEIEHRDAVMHAARH